MNISAEFFKNNSLIGEFLCFWFINRAI